MRFRSAVDTAVMLNELLERKARPVAFPESQAVLDLLRPRVTLGLITNGAPDIQREKSRAP